MKTHECAIIRSIHGKMSTVIYPSLKEGRIAATQMRYWAERHQADWALLIEHTGEIEVLDVLN